MSAARRPSTISNNAAPSKPAPAPSEPGALAQMRVADALTEHREAFEARRELRARYEPIVNLVSWCTRTRDLAVEISRALEEADTELAVGRAALAAAKREQARVIGQRAAADQALARVRPGSDDDAADEATIAEVDLDLRALEAPASIDESLRDPDPELDEGIERLEHALRSAETDARRNHLVASEAVAAAEGRSRELWLVAAEIDREARARVSALTSPPTLGSAPLLALDTLVVAAGPELAALEAELESLEAILARTTDTALDAAGRLVAERRAAGFADPIRGFL